MKSCSVDQCESPVEARGLCPKHRARMRRHGDVNYQSRAEWGEPLEWLKRHVGFTEDVCLPWPYGKGADGQGRVTYQNGRRISSRVMCSLAHGDAPDPSLDAAHSCGNGHLGCVNPKHLRWATHLENMSDAIGHQTVKRGSAQWNSALCDDQVREIRALVAAGNSQRQVAKAFGIHFNTVSMIILGKRWGWLT